MVIARKSDIVSIQDSETDLLEAESAEYCTIVSLILGNIDTDATVTLHLTKSGEASIDIMTDLPVAAGEAVEFFIGGKGSLFLEPGDKLSATASVSDDIAATLSWLSET